VGVQILQRVPNNYETDLIFPIVAAAAKLAGLDYHAASEQQQTSLKVGFHAAAFFLVAVCWQEISTFRSTWGGEV
jgi:alanyl-tRNA synthetase